VHERHRQTTDTITVPLAEHNVVHDCNIAAVRVSKFRQHEDFKIYLPET